MDNFKRKKLRNGITAIAAILLIIWIFTINFDDLSWKANSSNYLGILAMGFLVANGIMRNKRDTED
jgi:hypothetical protein